MDRPSPEIVDCPHCGARNFAIDDDCVRCRRGLTLFIGPWAKVRRVGLGSVMLVIAVVAICLAPVRVAGVLHPLRMHPPPGHRACDPPHRGSQGRGRPMIVREKIGAFIISTVITFAILVLASTAFVATCRADGRCILGTSNMNRPEPGIIVGCIAGRGPRTPRHLPPGPAPLASEGLTP
ncbi:MAG: hypothetical protein WKF75_04865 [Singulisphaera sp.]